MVCVWEHGRDVRCVMPWPPPLSRGFNLASASVYVKDKQVMYIINYDVFVNRNALFMYTDYLINNALHGGRSLAASSLVIQLIAFVCISYILLNL